MMNPVKSPHKREAVEGQMLDSIKEVKENESDQNLRWALEPQIGSKA